jgi:glucan phosphoethanolaminetransferase (alkaline phosphatase superfamily)
MTDADGKKGLRGIFRSRPFVMAALFCTFLFFFEAIFLPRVGELMVFASRFEDGLYRSSLNAILTTGASTVVAFLFFWAVFASGWIFRILYFLLFSITVVTEYGVYRAFHRFSSLVDVGIAVFAGDPRFTAQAGLIYFNYWAFIPITVFMVLLFATKPVLRRSLLVFAMTIVLLGGFFFLSAYFTPNRYYALSFSETLRSTVDLATSWYIGKSHGVADRFVYAEPRRTVGFKADTTPTNNIVMIVDESLNGDHLSLNGYRRPTSPKLEELARNGFLKNWGVAAAGATCSVSANVLLATGVNILPDDGWDIYRLPTIFSFARAMNYKNYYFDGQVTWAWNGKPSDIRDFGTWVKTDELQKAAGAYYDIDGEIARRVREITSTSTGNFIWINKCGVHEPYRVSYPTDGNGLPLDGKGYYTAGSSLPQTIIDNYDNAVDYNQRVFFDELIKERPDKDTFYIYTSDHGEYLTDDRQTAGHCGDVKQMASVPLAMIAEPPALDGVDVNFKASHSNIFATLLDLMAFPDDQRPYAYSISLLKAKATDSRPRTYYNGHLNHGEYGANYPFD